VDAEFVNRRLADFTGKSYAPSEITSLRENLRSIDVFESVKVKPAESLDETGRLPIDVEVVERDRRFIGFGANYSTNDGAGAKAYWGHRNLFGGGEHLRLDADISGLGENSWSETNYGLSADFNKPDFLRQQQSLHSNLALVQEYDPDTFDKKAATLSLGLERRLSQTLSVSFGGEAEISRITDDGVARNFELFGPTGAVNLDTSDDLLNPTKGSRLSLTGAAFSEYLGSSQDVFQTRATGSSYLDLSGKGNLVLAGRLSLASVFGGSIDELPEDRLLYAGGGGSVRGYEFRSISPIDEDGDPTGGRSLVEGSVELRYRFLEDYGIVPFFDAGTVTEEVFPSFDEKLQYAGGLGFRYYSPIGPIRADVAVPLNPRKDDDPVAFYISIGQAF
jgi:translocation and assembly module TamA